MLNKSSPKPDGVLGGCVAMPIAMSAITDSVASLQLKSGINDQAISNMIAIPVQPPFFCYAAGGSVQQLLLFAKDHYSNIARKAKHPEGVLFYAWMDILAGQLRFSAISGDFKQPPFGCKCDFDASADHVAADVFVDDDSLHGPADTLSVWTQRIS